MLAGPGRGQGNGVVQVVGHADIDGVHIAALDHLLPADRDLRAQFASHLVGLAFTPFITAYNNPSQVPRHFIRIRVTLANLAAANQSNTYCHSSSSMEKIIRGPILIGKDFL